MQRGSQSLMMSGGAAAGVSRPDLLAGAQLQAASLPLENVFSFDASTSNVEILHIRPESVFGSSPMTSFHVPAISQPGLQYDLHGSELIFSCNLTTSNSCGPCWLASLGLFNEFALYINGVLVQDQNASMEAYPALVKLSLQEPYTNRAPYTNVDQGGIARQVYSLNDREALSQIYTPPLCYPQGQAALVGYQTRVASSRFVSEGQNGKWICRIPLRYLHSFFHAKQYLPASFDLRFQMKTVDSTFRWGGMAADAAGDFVVTNAALDWYLPKITMTVDGLRVYNQLLGQTMGVLNYPMLRSQVQLMQMPVGQANFSWNLASTVIPQAIAIHLVPQDNMSPATKPTTYHWAEQNRSNKGQISQLYVDVAGQRFPRYSDRMITRQGNATSNNMVGGTAVLDTQSYLDLCAQFAKDEIHTQPFFTYNNLTNGNLGLIYINCTQNQDKLLGFKPALKSIGPISVNLTLGTPLAGLAYTAVITLLWSDVCRLRPATGQVQLPE